MGHLFQVYRYEKIDCMSKSNKNCFPKVFLTHFNIETTSHFSCNIFTWRHAIFSVLFCDINTFYHSSFTKLKYFGTSTTYIMHIFKVFLRERKVNLVFHRQISFTVGATNKLRCQSKKKLKLFVTPLSWMTQGLHF